jgi:hypothetical protein
VIKQEFTQNIEQKVEKNKHMYAPLQPNYNHYLLLIDGK